jgi:hypothetical protein
MDELKERNCFHFCFWGKWDNGRTQGEKLCQQLLDRNRMMDEFGEIWLKEIGKWNLGKLVEFFRGSGIVDELYKGSALVEKVAQWSLITYRRLKFFQFPKESWTILNVGWNIIELLEKMEDIGWIQRRWNLAELHWGKVKQVILVAWKLQTWPKEKTIGYEKGNIIKIINLNLKMTKKLWYVILEEKFRAKVKAIINP